jgi:hypothetical protein
MKPGRWREGLLFLFFVLITLAMVVTGYKTDQIPETLFNATLV